MKKLLIHIAFSNLQHWTQRATVIRHLVELPTDEDAAAAAWLNSRIGVTAISTKT